MSRTTLLGEVENSCSDHDAEALAARTLARAIGLSAFVFAYPLVEIYRTCRKQTGPRRDAGTDSVSRPDGSNARMPLNTLYHGSRPATSEDRDVVTPANDLLYSVAWIHLADGPMLLTLPASQQHGGRFYVMALYDVYTENFENLGPRNASAQGEAVLLCGPGQPVPKRFADHRIVRCPDNLVWMIGRIVVGDERDWPDARAMQACLHLTPALDDGAGGRSKPQSSLPPSLQNWVGEPDNVMVAALEQRRPIADLAPAFYANFCHALNEVSGRPEDRGLLAWFAQAGLMGDAEWRWEELSESTRCGLLEGFEEGVHLVAAARHEHRPKPWMLNTAAGRYGTRYLSRARTAYWGLGALATSEAVYAVAHCDVDLQPLSGEHVYELRFEANDLPAVDAFWSVTLYGADRFLHPNALKRHSIGDRTEGLRYEQDQSLVITFAHHADRLSGNCLPAPAGQFYLVLRMYHPRAEVMQWRIPPLRKLQAA